MFRETHCADTVRLINKEDYTKAIFNVLKSIPVEN